MWAERGKQKADQQKAGQGREAAQCERRCQAGVGGVAGESLEKGFWDLQPLRDTPWAPWQLSN